MATEQQKRFGRLPIHRPKKPKVERDPLSGKPLDELREQQPKLRREFYDRQAKRAKS